MLTIIILHGSSSVGKTYSMSRLVMENPNLIGLEMDDCRYWDKYEPVFNGNNLLFISPPPTLDEYNALLTLYNDSPIEHRRCIVFLISQLQKALRSNEQANVSERTIIATCGALPFPSATGVSSLYNWLSERLPVAFTHVLLEVPEHVHLDQMKKRKRLHLKEKILNNNVERTARRELHDIVASDYDTLVSLLRNQIKQGYQQKTLGNHAERNNRVRIHKNTGQDLRYIQTFGERNSGTNHLKRLVSEYMHCPDNFLGSWASEKNPINGAKLFGYKHYYAEHRKLACDAQRETLFLVIYKNPYTWIRSTLIKPYHFKVCLEGKTIEDLPNLPLAGFNVRGDEIPDVHPETGERISIFELRKHKIINWENLVNQVHNVAYVNYEDLLLRPTEIVQDIVTEFGSLFSSQQVAAYKTDAKYIEKYVDPEPFSQSEMDAIDANIDWSVESRIGYKRGNLFIPS